MFKTTMQELMEYLEHNLFIKLEEDKHTIYYDVTRTHGLHVNPHLHTTDIEYVGNKIIEVIHNIMNKNIKTNVFDHFILSMSDQNSPCKVFKIKPTTEKIETENPDFTPFTEILDDGSFANLIIAKKREWAKN